MKKGGVPIDEWIDKTTQENICVDYKNGMSRRNIMEKYSVGDLTVVRVLQRNNIPVYFRIIHKRDFTFFRTIDTEKKAYWLGALYADGNISCSERYGVAHASFSSTDLDWIEMFKSDISYSGPILTEHHNKYDKDIYKINFGNKEMARDLVKQGCVPAKSLIMDFPVLPEELVHHFVRGYFDGDGCVYLSQPTWHYKDSNESLIKSTVLSGSRVFLERLVFELPCLNKKILGRSGHENNFIVNWNTSDTCILYDYMYDGATRYLPRKKAKFDEYFKVRGSTTIISDSDPNKE